MDSIFMHEGNRIIFYLMLLDLPGNWHKINSAMRLAQENNTAMIG
jgi:hypothetical protein